MNRLAIIPCKAKSSRLPGKNTRDFYGKPMFIHTLIAARNSGLFSEIYLSTDSEEIKAISEQHGFHVPWLRPEEFTRDTVQLEGVCQHALNSFADQGKTFDEFCLLWATAPLRTSDDICSAHKLLDDNTEAVVATCEYPFPPLCAMTEDIQGFLKPMFPDYMMLPSQQHPRLITDNGSLCWVRVKAFCEQGTWLPQKTRSYLMPRNHSVDIDTREDWDMAEYYYGKYFPEKP